MKNGTKTALVLAAILIAAGLVIGTISFAFTAINNLSAADVVGHLSGSYEYVNHEKTFPADSIELLVVKEDNNAILMYCSDNPSEKNITVSYWERSDGKEIYEFSIKDEALTVDHIYKPSINFFNFDVTDTTLVITVPADFDAGVSIDTSNGRTSINEITFSGALTVDSSNGRVTLDNVSAGSVDVKASNGSIALTDVSVSSICSAQDNNGSITMDTIKAGSINVKNSNGSIELIDTTAKTDLTAKNSSGRIRLKNAVAGSLIKLTNSNGSISGTIVGKESDFTIIADSDNGSCNLENSVGGRKILEADSGNGSIKLEFTEE